MSRNLYIACKQMVDSGALEELEDIIERDAFELWKSLESGADEPARQRLRGNYEAITLIRNLAAEIHD